MYKRESDGKGKNAFVSECARESKREKVRNKRIKIFCTIF